MAKKKPIGEAVDFELSDIPAVELEDTGGDVKLVDPTPDPLADIERTGNAADDSGAELSALLQGFKNRAKDESLRAKEATDTLHWFAVSFQTREQMTAFLKAAGWSKLLDDQYIDGSKLAKLEGIDLPHASLRYQGEKIDRKIADLPSIE